MKPSNSYLAVVVLAAIAIGTPSQAIDFKKFAKDSLKEAVGVPAQTPPPEENKPQPAQPAEPEPVAQNDRLALPPTIAGIHKAKGGFSVSLPAQWVVSSDEATTFTATFSGEIGVAMTLILNDFGANFPVAASLKANSDTAKKELAAGKLIRYRDLTLGKAKGTLRVEKAPADSGDPQRYTFQGFAGSTSINIVASSRGKTFNKNQAHFDTLIRSLKF